jgi:hypothetical protein
MLPSNPAYLAGHKATVADNATAERLAIMQPYFFPYLGYFSLIAAADQFIVFDVVQYIRHGWVNRNRILKPDFGSDQYVLVPLVKHPRGTLICDVAIANHLPWKTKLLAQLQHYKKRARFFKETRELVAAALEFDTDSLVDLNVHCLATVCWALRISFDEQRLDRNALNFQKLTDSIQKPGDWALQLSVQRQAKTYLNPPTGQEIFDAAKFQQNGVELGFVRNRLAEYDQKNSQFVAGLSIIDSLMFNGIDRTRELITDYEVIKER